MVRSMVVVGIAGRKKGAGNREIERKRSKIVKKIAIIRARRSRI